MIFPNNIFNKVDAHSSAGIIMKLIGNFISFVKRVLKAAKKGGLGKRDQMRLSSLLEDDGWRFSIMASSLISVFGKASKKDTKKLAKLLERIYKDKGKTRKFTNNEKKEIEGIFRRAEISKKTERWFERRMNQFLAEELHERLTGKKRIQVTVPTKKTVKLEKNKTKKRKKMFV